MQYFTACKFYQKTAFAFMCNLQFGRKKDRLTLPLQNILCLYYIVSQNNTFSFAPNPGDDDDKSISIILCVKVLLFSSTNKISLK